MQLKLLSKKDIWLILGFLVIILMFFIYYHNINSSSNLTAIISKDSEVLYQIDLSSVSEPYEIQVGGEFPLTILVENNSICVDSATCKDQICVHTGKIDKPSQSIVCLPNRVTITIKGNSNNDAVTG